MNREPMQLHRRPCRVNQPSGGFSLMEVLVVLTIFGVLISIAVPSFNRTLEQSRADVAGANLRAIWSAERLYWLENHAYTADLNDLEVLGLLDPSIVSASAYFYSVAAADDNSFTAVATRTGSAIWSGQFSLDQSGALWGTIDAAGKASIQPGLQ